MWFNFNYNFITNMICDLVLLGVNYFEVSTEKQRTSFLYRIVVAHIPLVVKYSLPI